MGSILYDSTGRRKEALVEIDWTEITGIPARVLEIASLVDPNALRYVGWDDIANQLKLLTFDADFIPYNNAVSGLTATTVQDAIDELAASISASAVFFGHVGSDGSTGNSLPAGWSASRLSLGVYLITHNLGDADYGIVATMGSVNQAGRTQVSHFNKAANDVEIHWYNQTDGPAFTDVPFDFSLKLIA
jgi:hypothetical protein